MKRYIIIILILLTTSLVAKNLTFNPSISVETTYNSNILSLSENDLNRFESGNEPDKFLLETSDDLITSAKVELNLKHRFLAGHTQINRFAVKYNKLLNNDFVDNYYFEFALKQYLSKKLKFGFYYYFYPETFVNRYDSVLDDENIFRDFSYSKNYYIGKINYSLNSKYQFNYKFSLSQLFYNEYFTEYDADNFENEIGIGITPLMWLRVKADYSYKISKAQAGAAFEDPELVTIIKDGSYRSDIFELSLLFPEVISISSSPVTLKLGTKVEHTFFQSDNELDEYHYGREDLIATFNSDVNYKISKNLSLKYFYEYKLRETNSPYSNVVVDKEYDLHKTGLTITYSL